MGLSFEYMRHIIGEDKFEQLRNIDYNDIQQHRESLKEISPAVCRACYQYATAYRSSVRTFPHGQEQYVSMVPRRIVQFWDKPDVPADVRKVMSSWTNIPDIDYVLFSDDSAREYILKHFGNEACSAYDHSHHAAMKADIFRLAYLLGDGGIYMDADDESTGLGIQDDLDLSSQVGLAPLFWDCSKNQLMNPDEDFCDAIAGRNTLIYLNNAPLMAAKGNAFIKILFECVVRNVCQDRKFGRKTDIHEDTGPGIVTACFVAHVLKNGFAPPSQDWIGLLPNWNRAIARKWLDYKSGPGHWFHA